MKLTIELVPTTLWGKNIREYIGQKAWKEIKNIIFEQEGKKCYICNFKGLLDLHETWHYDDVNKIQKLVALHHLCKKCHAIKHLGFSFLTDEGEYSLKSIGLNKEMIINHYCKINNCSKKDFEEHKDEAFKIQSERSLYEWKQDINYLIEFDVVK